MDNKEIHLHDPAGFPHVLLSLDKLKIAWKAEDIGYSKEFYRYWTAPKRISSPTKKDIYKSAIQLFKSLYENSRRKAKEEKWVVGKNVILTCANRIRDKKARKMEIEQLTYFALPLGAKRALDFAVFFDPFDNDLADLKRKQAMLFGRAQTFAVRKDLEKAADILKELAKIEEKFRLALLSK